MRFHQRTENENDTLAEKKKQLIQPTHLFITPKNKGEKNTHQVSQY